MQNTLIVKETSVHAETTISVTPDATKQISSDKVIITQSRKPVRVSPKADNKTAKKKVSGSSSNEKKMVQLTIAQAAAAKSPVTAVTSKMSGTPKKRKIEELLKEEEDCKAKITSLKLQKARLQKILEGNNAVEAHPPAPTAAQSSALPQPVGLNGVPEDFIPDLLFVWDFQYMFSKELRLAPLQLDDLAELLAYQGQPSIALTELFLALLRLLLQDQGVSQTLLEPRPRACDPNAPSPCIDHKALAAVLPDPAVDIYNGLSLLPVSGATLLLNGRTWPCFLRAVLPKLSTVAHLRAVEKVRYEAITASVQADLLAVGTGPDVDAVLGVCNNYWIRNDGYNCRNQKTILAACEQLEVNEPHCLNLKHKLALLSLLCDAVCETARISDVVSKNADDRLAVLASQAATSRAEKEEKRKARELSAELREKIIEQCRQANIARERAEKGKKGKGKSAGKASADKSKDPYYPSQAQLVAAVEEAVVLRAASVDVVVPTAPSVPEVSDDEEDELKEEVEVVVRRRSTRDVSKAEIRRRRKQERENILRDRVDAEARLTALLTTTQTDAKTLRLLREAVKLGTRAGLVGRCDDGSTYCTDLMRQAYKAVAETETVLREEEVERETSKALAELFVRSEPLGTDRFRRRYWSFEGDDRLWVETLQCLGNDISPAGCNGTTVAPRPISITNLLTAGDLNIGPEMQPFVNGLQLDAAQVQLIRTRPSRWISSWAAFHTAREVWALHQALDLKGEEGALKKVIATRLPLEEPSELKKYLTSGHEWLGRKVSRKFGKRAVTGTITGWLPADGEDMPLWRVTHTDGDEEDLEEREVTRGLLPQAAPGEEVVPGVVANYVNDLRGAVPVPPTSIGLPGLRSDMLLAMSLVADGLKSRGSGWGRDVRRDWERAVREANVVAGEGTGLRQLLLQLEAAMRAVQTEEDLADDTEEERALAASQEHMLAEGWVFEPAEEGGAAHITRRVRRFFPEPADGSITAYLPADKNEGKALWHMQHDDGDQEDLDEAEVAAALRAFDEGLTEAEETDDKSVGDDEEAPGQDDEQPDDIGAAKRLWPTVGTRLRWQTAVTAACTVAELSLALTSLTEHARAFGLADPEPLQERDRSMRRTQHTAAMWDKKLELRSPSGKSRQRLSMKAVAEKESKAARRGRTRAQDRDRRQPEAAAESGRVLRDRSVQRKVQYDEDSDDDSDGWAAGRGLRKRKKISSAE